MAMALLWSLRLITGTAATHRASAHAILSTSGLSGERWHSKMLHHSCSTEVFKLNKETNQSL